MTEKEIKEYLNRAYYLDFLISSNLEELKKMEELLSMNLGIDYSSPKVKKTTSNQANFENIAITIADFKNKYKNRLLELFQLKDEIISTINLVDDDLIKAILIKRHIEYKSWFEIYSELYISRSHCFRKYNSGIKKLQKLINK